MAEVVRGVLKWVVNWSDCYNAEAGSDLVLVTFAAELGEAVEAQDLWEEA